MSNPRSWTPANAYILKIAPGWTRAAAGMHRRPASGRAREAPRLEGDCRRKPRPGCGRSGRPARRGRGREGRLNTFPAPQ